MPIRHTDTRGSCGTVILAALALLAWAGAAPAATVLITGANSGIGLEFAKEYGARGWTVIATHRHPETPDALKLLESQYKNVRIEKMDVTSHEQILALAAKLHGVPIDVLINNAGVYQMGDTYANQKFGQLNYDYFDTFVATNIKGPMMVTEAFIDNVKASTQKKVISISSSHGMITEKPLVLGAFWYGMTKAALNKEMMTLSYVLKPDGVTVVLFHPGAVLTEKQASLKFPGMIETTVSVGGMIKTIDHLTLADSGHFLLYNGSPQAW